MRLMVATFPTQNADDGTICMLMMNSSEILPVIDLSKVDRRANAQLLAEAMRTVGFVYLDNVPGYDKEVEAALHKATEWFFSLPLDKKVRLSPKKWNKDAKCLYRGYVPINVAEGHLREQYEMGEVLPEDDPYLNSGNPLYEATAWPLKEPEGIQFRDLMMTHYHTMTNAGMEFLRLTAMGLGMDEHLFDDRFLPKPVSSLRIMHYPSYMNSEASSITDTTFTCEEHIDTVFVTLLVTFSYPGLEILRDGTWVRVAPRPGSLVVNVGDLMSKVTKGKFKATYHRVRDTGIDRFSIPFFFEPRSDAKFEFPDSSVVTYGPWMVNRLRRHKYQFAHLPDIV